LIARVCIADKKQQIARPLGQGLPLAMFFHDETLPKGVLDAYQSCAEHPVARMRSAAAVSFI